MIILGNSRYIYLALFQKQCKLHCEKIFLLSQIVLCLSMLLNVSLSPLLIILGQGMSQLGILSLNFVHLNPCQYPGQFNYLWQEIMFVGPIFQPIWRPQQLKPIYPAFSSYIFLRASKNQSSYLMVG